jgi:predicted AAA+ superfamily ATPase
MKPRSLSRVIARAQKTFPAIVVTGPRQSGKTTLLKSLFAKTHKFVSLEDPDARIRTPASSYPGSSRR